MERTNDNKRVIDTQDSGIQKRQRRRLVKGRPPCQSVVSCRKKTIDTMMETLATIKSVVIPNIREKIGRNTADSVWLEMVDATPILCASMANRFLRNGGAFVTMGTKAKAQGDALRIWCPTVARKISENLLAYPRNGCTESFRLACRKGDIESVEWMVGHCRFVGCVGKECLILGIEDACRCGRIDVVKSIVGMMKTYCNLNSLGAWNFLLFNASEIAFSVGNVHISMYLLDVKKKIQIKSQSV